MSLATRCTSCGTVFRVVQDQLKVSEGWVRCGRCQVVFNARDSLFDVDEAAAAEAANKPPQHAAHAPDESPRGDAPPPLDDTAATAQPASDDAPEASAPDALRPEIPAEDNSAVAPSDTADTVPGLTTPSVHLPEPEPDPPVPRPQAVTLPTFEPALAVDDNTDLTLIDPELAALAQATPASTEPEPALIASDFADDTVPMGLSAGPVWDRHVAPLDAAASSTGAGPAAADDGLSLGTLLSDIAAQDERAASRAAVRDSDLPVLDDGYSHFPQWDFPDDDDQAADGAAKGGAMVPVVPGFVRQADRAARWRHPVVRAGLGLVALGLLALLAAQAAIAWRNELAQAYPELRPELAQACETLGCTLTPVRRVDDLLVDSSGLVKAGSGGLGEVYRLSLVVRNRGALALQVPAVDLTLTDADGRIITRRVLSARDMNQNAELVAGGAELPLHTLLSTPGRTVAGYTVEIFYP